MFAAEQLRVVPIQASGGSDSLSSLGVLQQTLRTLEAFCFPTIGEGDSGCSLSARRVLLAELFLGWT